MGNKLQIQRATTATLQESGIYEVPFVYEGAPRDYLACIPKTHWKDPSDPFQGRPVIIAIHGGTGNPYQMLKSHATDLLSLAESEGFNIVFPQGSGPITKHFKFWNCYPGLCGYSAKKNIDDTTYILQVLQDFSKRTTIHPRRIYAMGISNGGMMCYRLAVDPKASLVIAAICPIAGGVCYLPQEKMQQGYQGFEPQRPISICHIHSVDDPRALYEGGISPLPFTKKKFEHSPVRDMINQWVTFNCCSSSPSTSPTIRGVGQYSSHTATEIRYSGGRDGTEVVHWKLTGVGHTWPTPNPLRNSLGEQFSGEVSSVIDSGAIAWSFFKSHPLPEKYLHLSPLFSPSTNNLPSKPPLPSLPSLASSPQLHHHQSSALQISNPNNFISFHANSAPPLNSSQSQSNYINNENNTGYVNPPPQFNYQLSGNNNINYVNNNVNNNLHYGNPQPVYPQSQSINLQLPIYHPPQFINQCPSPYPQYQQHPPYIPHSPQYSISQPQYPPPQ